MKQGRCKKKIIENKKKKRGRAKDQLFSKGLKIWVIYLDRREKGRDEKGKLIM